MMGVTQVGSTLANFQAVRSPHDNTIPLRLGQARGVNIVGGVDDLWDTINLVRNFDKK